MSDLKNILNLTFNDYFIQFPLPYFVIICSFLTHSEGEKDFYFPWKPSLMLEFLEIFRCCRLVSDFNVDFQCPENGKREEFFLQRTSITQIIFLTISICNNSEMTRCAYIVQKFCC